MIKPFTQVTLPHYIPFMLGSIIILIAFDHALHCYAENYSHLWFFKDYKRTELFDYFYLIDQSIIMPVLFFCMGNIFVYQIKNNTALHVIKKMFCNYVVPFLGGILFIVPLLVYPRYNEYQDPNISFLEFYQTLFFERFIQAGPFWVMYALMLYSLIAWIWLILSPNTLNFFTHKLITTNPFIYLAFIFIMLLVSDLMWGTPWWIGFGKLFYLQGSRFITNFIFFLSGLHWCLNHHETTNDYKIFASKVVTYFLVFVTIVAAAAYCFISLKFRESPPSIHGLIQNGLSFQDIFVLIEPFIKIVSIRIICLTILMFTLFSLYHRVFIIYKFYNTKIWRSLSICGYGLFIFHEFITIWLQYYFVNIDLSPYLKVVIIFSVSVITSWFITAQLIHHKFFRKFLVIE